LTEEEGDANHRCYDAVSLNSNKHCARAIHLHCTWLIQL